MHALQQIPQGKSAPLGTVVFVVGIPLEPQEPFNQAPLSFAVLPSPPWFVWQHVLSRHFCSSPGCHSHARLRVSSILLSLLAIGAEPMLLLLSARRAKSTTTTVPKLLLPLGPYEPPDLIMNTRRCSSSTPVTLLVYHAPLEGITGLSMLCSCCEQGQRDARGGHMRMGDCR